MSLANIYTGCKCGETWQVTSVEHIDSDRDKIYHDLMCLKCYGTNLIQKKTAEGVPYMYELTHDEIMWELSLADDDDDEYSYNYDCEVCGGEVCEDSSSCICGIDDDQLF